jgi:hypothetical protein
MSDSIGQIGQAIGGAVTDIGQYIGANYTIAGEEAAAKGFQTAAQIALENSQEAEAAGKLQQIQTQRQVYMTAGAGVASAAGNGLKIEGSAMNIMKSTAAQGAVAGQLIGTQTQINVNGYMQQMAADTAEMQQAQDAANAAKSSKTFDLIGAGIQGVTAISEIAAMV